MAYINAFRFGLRCGRSVRSAIRYAIQIVRERRQRERDDPTPF